MPGLLEADSALQQKEVEHLARVMSRTAGQELHIIVYNTKDKNEARATALNLRRLLIDQVGSGQTAPPRQGELVRYRGNNPDGKRWKSAAVTECIALFKTH
jgi:hypothetical protein